MAAGRLAVPKDDPTLQQLFDGLLGREAPVFGWELLVQAEVQAAQVTLHNPQQQLGVLRGRHTAPPRGGPRPSSHANASWPILRRQLGLATPDRRRSPPGRGLFDRCASARCVAGW